MAASSTFSIMKPYKLVEVRANTNEGARVYELAERSGFKVSKVERVHNAALVRTYLLKREWMGEFEKPSCDALSVILASRLEAGLPPDTPPYKDNEALLFHKTGHDSIIPSVLEIGLSKCYSPTNAPRCFGLGIYFSDDLNKSHLYGDGNQVLLCRVVLGDCVNANKPNLDWDMKSAPRKPDCHKRYEGDVQFSSWYGARNNGNQGKYNEFIVKDDQQVYPQYVITYKSVNPKSSKIDPPNFIIGLQGGSRTWLSAVTSSDGDIGELDRNKPPSQAPRPGSSPAVTETKPLWECLPSVAELAGFKAPSKALICPDGTRRPLYGIVHTIGRGKGDTKLVISPKHVLLIVDVISGHVFLKVLSKSGMHFRWHRAEKWQFLSKGEQVLMEQKTEFCLLDNLSDERLVKSTTFITEGDMGAARVPGSSGGTKQNDAQVMVDDLISRLKRESM
mmetsp:Transcript_28465/g.39326  ORF Transcript_28465/g.39326 Transcript_28465/m.39326 type:complete len:448 (+) Transcript_28465:164-1507(+)